MQLCKKDNLFKDAMEYAAESKNAEVGGCFQSDFKILAMEFGMCSESPELEYVVVDPLDFRLTSPSLGGGGPSGLLLGAQGV